MPIHELAEVARKCRRDGIGALSPTERQLLSTLFEKETRKGAFKVFSSDPDEVLASFCDHVEAEFSQSSDVLVAADFLLYLKRKATEQASESVPLASLILLAAWLEHWTNMVISVGMLRRGSTVKEIEEYFAAQPSYECKLRQLGAALGITQLPKTLFDWAMQVMKTRNRYLHYTWTGRGEQQLYRDVRGISALVRKGEAKLDVLSKYEHENFDAPFAELTKRIFERAR